MISAREKGLFQIMVAFQIAAVVVVFMLCALNVLVFFHGQEIPYYDYTKYAVVAAVALMLEASWRPVALRPAPGRVRRLAASVSYRQWGWMLASVTGLMVFTRDAAISRIFLAVFAASSLIVLHVTNRFLLGWLGSLGIKHLRQWRLRTVVLGPKSWCESVLPEVIGLSSMVDVKRVEFTDGPDASAANYLALVSEQPVDLLVMAPRHLPDDTVMELMRQGDRLGFRCWLPLELTRAYRRRFHLQRVGRLDVLSPPVEPLENTSHQFVKRVLDLAFSLVMVLTILPPLCLIVWIIHRRYSPGPLFFKQDRVGKNGMTFKVFKFRTLHVQNDDAAKQVTSSDSRVFKGGRMLRRLSLDEMPQFINVLLSDMSVVGPRPHMEQHDCEFREIFERYGVRRYVKPGVTGLAQVKGFRGEVNRPLDLRHRARLDNFYVTHWDATLDLRIIAMTGLSMIRPPKTAY